MTHAAAAHHTSMGLDSRKMAFWAFIGSECLLFGSLISTYLIYKGKSVVGPYPHDILNIPFTSVSTFDLLMSSLMMVLALAAVQRGDLKWAKIWLFATAFLGILFLGGQVYEFSSFVREGLTLQTNLFGCTFFVLTGTHGAHVTVGVLWLPAVLVFSSTPFFRSARSWRAGGGGWGAGRGCSARGRGRPAGCMRASCWGSSSWAGSTCLGEGSPRAAAKWPRSWGRSSCCS